MAADRRGVDTVMSIVGHRLPDDGLSPPSEALKDGHSLAVILRQVVPRRTGADEPQDAIDDEFACRSPTGAYGPAPAAEGPSTAAIPIR